MPIFQWNMRDLKEKKNVHFISKEIQMVQSINQSVSQSINQSKNQSVKQSINQSIKRIHIALDSLIVKKSQDLEDE